MADVYGLSSLYSYSPGLDANYIDHLVVHPHTGWTGTRGVRVSFGSLFEDDEDEFEEELVFGADDEDEEDDADLDALEAEIDADLAEAFGSDADYGRLYLGEEDWRLAPASPGDLGSLLGRSGSSGYRGGRPTFGGNDARIKVPGVLEYQGSPAGAVALGVAALLLLFKNPPWVG